MPGSASWRVEQALARQFDSPFSQVLLVVLEGADRTDAAVALPLRLAREEWVTQTRRWPTDPGEPAVLAVGLRADGLAAAEPLVKPLRKAVAGLPHVRSGRVKATVTGQAALGVDLNDHAARASATAEKRVLPLTLLALVFAFGALGAAVAPLVAGAAAVIAALGLLRLISEFMPLSVYASTIASMLGLGLGIDYALLVVSRIREEGDLTVAVRRSAPLIAVSAATVVIGLFIMATVPVQDLVGLGVGGAVVAFTAATAGITLLPAVAALLGRWLEAPRLLSGLLDNPGRLARWRERARRVVARRGLALGVAALVLLALAAPLRGVDLGFPELGQMPAEIETMRGWRTLERLRTAGALVPVDILVTNPPGKSIVGSALAVSRAARFLEADPRVAEVRTFIGPARPGYLELARSLGIAVEETLPPRSRWLLSRDGRSTLIQVVLKNGVSLADREAFHARVSALPWTRFLFLPGVEVHVGGMTALNRDIEDTAVAAIPRIAALVVLATCLMLFATTRSILIPLKAVLANLLTVAAALGGTLALFRSEAGARLLGLDGPVLSVTPGIPILVFCVVFGLSMDYEVFLIARIKEAHDQGADDKDAVIDGLGATGGVITSAAAIMAIVFAGFALTDLIVIKMLGVALALGVLLDATVVRLLLIPALMVFAGRYNWYPGERRA
ncbi:MAG: MMPL family transporter [Candidatus Sericytochromatia bacterium]|nr:MMPL family transporter [Candidatus Tanganyikabacteria bacterium]